MNEARTSSAQAARIARRARDLRGTELQGLPATALQMRRPVRSVGLQNHDTAWLRDEVVIGLDGVLLAGRCNVPR